MVGPLTERLFVAVPIPPQAAAAVEAWRSTISVPGRAVPAQNLHVTLRFVGDVDEIGRDRLLGELDQTDWPSPFRLRLTGLGGFPSFRRATVAWLGIDGDLRDLDACAEGADAAADRAGLGREERPFRPHLTLARIRPPASLDHFDAAPLGVRMRVDHLVVIRSHLDGRRPRYEAIERFELGP